MLRPKSLEDISPSHLSHKEAIVLSKALCKAAEIWKMSSKHLGEVIGLSEASISRLRHGQSFLEQNTPAWQLAALFLRAFRGLDSYMGGHIENEILWLKAPNEALGGTPFTLMRSIEGLLNVVQYLDNVRKKFVLWRRRDQTRHGRDCIAPLLFS